jgi:hypothetical protein
MPQLQFIAESIKRW